MKACGITTRGVDPGTRRDWWGEGGVDAPFDGLSSPIGV